MRTSGFGLSALLIAVGAILAFAVSYETEGVDLNQIGIIVLLVGVGLGLLTLATMMVGNRTTVESSSQKVVDGERVAAEEKEVVVDKGGSA